MLETFSGTMLNAKGGEGMSVVDRLLSKRAGVGIGQRAVSSRRPSAVKSSRGADDLLDLGRPGPRRRRCRHRRPGSR